MFPEFEVCNTTRSTITEEPFSGYSGSPKPNRSLLLILFIRAGCECRLGHMELGHVIVHPGILVLPTVQYDVASDSII